MKKYIFLMASLMGMMSMTSCEKDLETYSDSTCRLNFYYDISALSDFKEDMAKDNYSFVYGDEAAVDDTLWYEVETMGFVADHDRPIALEQVPVDGVTNAVAGKHYVAFDDPSLAKYYVIPAGKARTKIPVVLLRDASLKNESVTLKFAIKPNGEFILGYEPLSQRQVTFTDKLSEPSYWSKDYGNQYYSFYISDVFGAYGVVKHQFLISETGEKWDDEYIDKLMTGDNMYLTYLAQKMTKRLAEVNAEREAKGQGPLAEADGTVVTIPED